MFIAIDFDATIVRQEGHAYDDITTPPEFMPGAREAVLSLRRAGHTLILWSARSSRSLLYNPDHDPLVRAGIRRIDPAAWAASLPVNQARYRQMVDFVNRELPGVFAIIDAGAADKPHVDLIIDDKALRLGAGLGGTAWSEIEDQWGAPASDLPPNLLDARICDLALTPEDDLADCLSQLQHELLSRRISFFPAFYLGDGDFWTTDRAISVNVPWFLANRMLWTLVVERTGPYSREDVLAYLRHEAGHAIGYAYEIWKRPDWAPIFGSFKQPYVPAYTPDPLSDDYVLHLHGRAGGLDHYAQKHPDEDWAETFAVWLSGKEWRERYRDWPRALAKLHYVGRVMSEAVRGHEPIVTRLGQRVPYTTIKDTVGEWFGKCYTIEHCRRRTIRTQT